MLEAQDVAPAQGCHATYKHSIWGNSSFQTSWHALPSYRSSPEFSVERPPRLIRSLDIILMFLDFFKSQTTLSAMGVGWTASTPLGTRQVSCSLQGSPSTVVHHRRAPNATASSHRHDSLENYSGKIASLTFFGLFLLQYNRAQQEPSPARPACGRMAEAQLQWPEVQLPCSPCQ